MLSSDGTIIQGHQRVQAAKLLGWSEIDVIVRSDLVGKVQLTYETFISDNLRRRHLSPLAKARCIQCLLESANQSEDATHQLVRDYVGKQLNLSGRSVQRYMQVLRLPAELQDAFDRSEIGLPQVATFFNLTLEERERIAEVARKGGDLSDAFDEARKEIFGIVQRDRHILNLPALWTNGIRSFDWKSRTWLLLDARLTEIGCSNYQVPCSKYFVSRSPLMRRGKRVRNAG